MTPDIETFSVSKTNTLNIIFCSEEPPISGVMLADAYGTLRERQC
ncbi:MAG: hypothetical protein RLZZ176_2000 [Cyanobacteriota bacterium]|jgi:hypothetical protein